MDPIKFIAKKKFVNEEDAIEGDTKSARLRDKYLKIRVKYTGEDLVIITALQTLYTLSYA